MRRKNLAWWIGTNVGRANLGQLLRDFVKYSNSRGGRAWVFYAACTFMILGIASLLGNQLTAPFLATASLAPILFFFLLFWLDYSPSIVIVVSVKKMRRGHVDPLS